MTPFALDEREQFEDVGDAPGPTGPIGFSQPLTHLRALDTWDTWSHGYAGDVYFRMGDNDHVVITLPPHTKAFYLYAEGWNRATSKPIEAIAQDGTSTGPIEVNGDGGAKYFGFYAVGTELQTITVKDPSQYSEFAVGEFGIAGDTVGALALPRTDSSKTTASRQPPRARSAGRGNIRAAR
jgi:hypothetical protein